jgi:CheY-like chemotaxis protein
VRTLIVDDHAEIRFILRIAAARYGLEVVGEAGNGQEAIALASSFQPDLILLDIAMPVMDGLEALPSIRHAAPTAKIVVLSAFEPEVLELPEGVAYENKARDLTRLFERLEARGLVDLPAQPGILRAVMPDT